MTDFTPIKKYSEKAYEFLVNFKEEDYADGRYDLDEEGLFANIMTFTTNPRENQKYEAHKKYIDVQYVLNGKEGFCLEPMDTIDQNTLIQPYSEESDIMFYSAETKGEYHVLSDGEYLVMGPDCAHMPGIAVDGVPSQVRKMVVKIPVK